MNQEPEADRSEEEFVELFPRLTPHFIPRDSEPVTRLFEVHPQIPTERQIQENNGQTVEAHKENKPLMWICDAAIEEHEVSDEFEFCPRHGNKKPDPYRDIQRAFDDFNANVSGLDPALQTALHKLGTVAELLIQDNKDIRERLAELENEHPNSHETDATGEKKPSFLSKAVEVLKAH